MFVDLNALLLEDPAHGLERGAEQLVDLLDGLLPLGLHDQAQLRVACRVAVR